MNQLTEMQRKLLDMLKFFHNYCEMNRFRYFVVGGTLLGAVRHKGFIPWDDDVDVGMPRKDYEEFLKLFGESMIDQYVVESVSSQDKGFCFAYAKLYDTSTTLIENTVQHLKRGVYIDVFPLDGVGNSLEEAKKHFAKIDKKKKILSLRTIKVNGQRSKYKDVLLKLVQALPDWLIDDKKLCRQIDALCKQKDYDQCSLVGNLTGAWGWKEVVPRECFGIPKLYQFEDARVYGHEDSDGYLTHIYGDWRKLPPKEKQVSHHDYYVDLNRSYL